jgi:esterase/lipase
MNFRKSRKVVTPLLESRHHPSGLNSRFYGGQLLFADYVSQQRQTITLARSTTYPDHTEGIVEGNAPFQLKPAKNTQAGQRKPFKHGVLLVHGLTDSPYFMRPLGRVFQESGFRVMAILLPGHGTQPGDLLEVRWQEWAKSVAYGIDQLAEEVDEIHLAGFSAGGTLSIYQSLLDERVHGLFLFSPALKISSRAAWAKLHKAYSWLIQSAKWVSIKPDRDFYKYESFPKNAAAQMHALIKAVNRLLRSQNLRIPVFAAASVDDSTADCSATLSFMRSLAHPSRKLVLYTTEANNTIPDISRENLEQVCSVVPEHKIVNFAHTSIVLPAEDPHYGAGGKFSNCMHYYPAEMEKYSFCINQPDQIWQGEITGTNLATRTLRRLMYNPHFAALECSLKSFIENLPD